MADHKAGGVPRLALRSNQQQGDRFPCDLYARWFLSVVGKFLFVRVSCYSTILNRNNATVTKAEDKTIPNLPSIGHVSIFILPTIKPQVI